MDIMDQPASQKKCNSKALKEEKRKPRQPAKQAIFPDPVDLFNSFPLSLPSAELSSHTHTYI